MRQDTQPVSYDEIKNLWTPEHRPYLRIDTKHSGRKLFVTVGNSDIAIAVFNKETGTKGRPWVEAAGPGALEHGREIPAGFEPYMNDTNADDLIAQVTKKINLAYWKGPDAPAMPYYLPGQVSQGEIEIANGSCEDGVQLFKWTNHDPICLTEITARQRNPYTL